jgi:hypothetical protein
MQEEINKTPLYCVELLKQNIFIDQNYLKLTDDHLYN